MAKVPTHTGMKFTWRCKENCLWKDCQKEKVGLSSGWFFISVSTVLFSPLKIEYITVWLTRVPVCVIIAVWLTGINYNNDSGVVESPFSNEP